MKRAGRSRSSPKVRMSSDEASFCRWALESVYMVGKRGQKARAVRAESPGFGLVKSPDTRYVNEQESNPRVGLAERRERRQR